MTLNAKGLHYRELNHAMRALLASARDNVVVENACGQRYIAAGLDGHIRITIKGVPGNDLGAFMNGPEIAVLGNVQDGVGNTMNSGKITIHGDAGDILGYAMRGGRIFVRGSVGYRAGIHMKAYKDRFPVVVIGGTAADYLGEYMAGGVLVVLGQDRAGTPIVGEYTGTGMHGGTVYLRGEVKQYQLGREVGLDQVDGPDRDALTQILAEYCHEFGLSMALFRPEDFVKLTPRTTRPYGTLYAY